MRNFTRRAATRAARGNVGPAIYLPQGPIEQAYREVVLALQSDASSREGTLASTFRIEEHVASWT